MRVARRFLNVALCAVAISTASGANPVFLNDLNHGDHRSTPKLMFPDTATFKVSSADAYLQSQAAQLKLPADLSNLELVSVRRSLVGIHIRYQQRLNGLPVEGGELVVSQRHKDGVVYQLYNNTYPVETSVAAAKQTIGADAALQGAWDHLHVHGKLRYSPKVDLIYVPQKTGFRLVYKTLIIVSAPRGYWEHKVDAMTGEVISVRRHEVNEKYAPDDVPDFSAYTGPVTSMQEALVRFETGAALASQTVADPSSKSTVDGTALVFDPDPRTTLMNDALLDTSPAATFDPAYFTRTLRDITLDAGVYSLEGPWVTIATIAGEDPGTPVSTTADGNWTAKRGDNAFNDAMCYFHIDQNQRYLQSLGYTGAAGIQDVSIAVDTDGEGGADNSHYASGINILVFGHGGVDDNEDADVILHEYGHALTYDTTPGWGGGDSGAIGEGFGDYWGASYSWTTLNGSTHHPEWAFSWDGHGSDTWSGRSLDKTSLTYDHNTTYGAHQYIGDVANGSDQLWGTPLYQAFRDLIAMGRPREEMDRIIIESFFGVGYGVKMRDMASATVKAAMELYPAGPHAMAFYDRFSDQSILIAFPLPDPTLTYPVGGESLIVGDSATIQWGLNGAPSQTVTRIEYTSQLAEGDSSFADDVESGVNGWVTSKTGGSDWVITTAVSHSPTHGWYAADDADLCDQYLTHSGIAVSNGTVLSFWHAYDLEQDVDGAYDGGVVEISTDGSIWVDVGILATQNGYTATIDTNYGSSIGGRPAFSGSSGGFIETKIPLGDYAGQAVHLRFRESDDISYASVGWLVDDVTVGVPAEWHPLAVTDANATSYAWTLPAAPGGGYAVRVKLEGSGSTDSAWDTSEAFSLATAPPKPTILGIAPSPGSGDPVLQWSSVDSQHYTVWFSSNLVDEFESVESNILATPVINTYTDTVHNLPVMFWRITVDP